MTIDGYTLEGPLGEGAMGTVWRARRRSSTGHPVALKRVRRASDGDQRERLRHEAEVLAGLDHPHIVRVFDVVADGDGIAIAMQLAAGGSLAEVLARRGALSAAEVVAIAVPVAQALESAHRRGILHGDVKPANILLTSDGEPLLSDFGIAGAAGGRSPLAARPSMGTAEYLDPAVAAGAAPGPHSDVYSLGVVCYEALVGVAPFLGATPDAVLAAAAAGARPLLEAAPAVPSALAAVLGRAMSPDPTHRFATAAALAAALRSTAAGLTPLPSATGTGVTAGETTGGDREGTERDVAGRSGDGLPSTNGTPFAGEPGRRTGAPLRETRPFGPHPPRRPPPAPLRRTGALLGRVAVVLAVAVAAFALDALDALGPTASDSPEALPSPPSLTAPTPATATTCDLPAPPAVTPGEVLLGDIDGDGCADSVVRTGNVLIRTGPGGEERFGLGATGDLPLLGDWDCNGRSTPGLYRPSTGQAFLFDDWASPRRPLPASRVIQAGRPGEPAPTVAPSECARRR